MPPTLEDIATEKPDYDLVRVLSDWYEDQDDLNAANALRWLADNNKWPSHGFPTKGRQESWWAGKNWVTSEVNANNRVPIEINTFPIADVIDFTDNPRLDRTYIVHTETPTLDALRWFIDNFHMVPQ